jgi:hypothetical protein
LIKIEDILSGDFSAYPEEARESMERFADKFREGIIDELKSDMADKILKDIDKSKDYFISALGSILENGFKGYNKMSTTALLEIFLDRKGEEGLINLLEKIDVE